MSPGAHGVKDLRVPFQCRGCGAPWSSRRADGRDRTGSLEVVGDGGEVNLGGGFGDADPSHPPEPVASLPGAEDFLDPAAHPVDGRVEGRQPRQRLLFVRSPHAGHGDMRGSALGANRLAEVGAAIGAVGEDLAGRIGQRIRPARPSLMLAGVTATSSTRTVSASAPTCALKP